MSRSIRDIKYDCIHKSPFSAIYFSGFDVQTFFWVRIANASSNCQVTNAVTWFIAIFISQQEITDFDSPTPNTNVFLAFKTQLSLLLITFPSSAQIQLLIISSKSQISSQNLSFNSPQLRQVFVSLLQPIILSCNSIQQLCCAFLDFYQVTSNSTYSLIFITNPIISPLIVFISVNDLIDSTQFLMMET